jgi:hypothetical protein
MDTWRQVDVAGSLAVTWATGRPHYGATQPPMCDLGTVHVIDSWELLHKLSHVLI